MFENGDISPELEEQLEELRHDKIVEALKELQEEIYQNAVDKGFWPELDDYKGVEWTHTQRTLEVQKRVNVGEKIVLIHSELSEALEAARDNILRDDHHCPEFTNFEIELADTVIRCFDTAAGFGFDLASAIITKMKFNKTRPRKHGKNF